jgi:hypothetical protein
MLKMMTPEEISVKQSSPENVVRIKMFYTLMRMKKAHSVCIASIESVGDGGVGYHHLDADSCIEPLCEVQDFLEAKAMDVQLKFFLFAGNQCDIFITPETKEEFIREHQTIIESIDVMLARSKF